MNIKLKTIHGISWSGASQFTRIIFQLVITAILARLLTPNDFGLIAMVIVFTNLVSVFSDFGLTAAIIQRKDLNDVQLSSCFWINIFTGFILMLLLIILSPLVSYFYNEVKLTNIVILLASTYLIYSFGILQSTLFAKALNFKPLAIIEILASLVSGISAVIFAFLGFGVWSLVFQQVITSILSVSLLWSFSNWKPKLLFNWHEVKELLNFGLNLTGFNFLNYFSRNLDNLLIGKFIGTAPLGYYNLAYNLLLFPLSNISQVIGRVMYPGLSAIQDDKKKFCIAYIKATQYIAMVTFPLMVGFFVIAPQLIMVIFGTQWERSIFLVQVFAFVGLFQSIATTVGWIFQSQGRTDIQFRWGLISTFIAVLSFIIGLRWDIEGVALAYSLVSFLLLFPLFIISFKLIDLKLKIFIIKFKSILFASLSMGMLIFLLRLYLETILNGNSLLILILCMLLGILFYILFLLVFDKRLIKDIFHVIKQINISRRQSEAIAV